MSMKRLAVVSLCFLFLASVLRAGESPDADAVDPLFVSESDAVSFAPGEPPRRFSTFFEEAELVLRSAYYGRARNADNDGRGGDRSAGEIHVNAFGQAVDFRSGYAWDVIGFDVTGQTNLGRGNGWSEVLLHKMRYRDDWNGVDRSSVSLGQAAAKVKLGGPDFGFEARGGFTPISIGTLGTSGGLFSHAYRGFEAKAIFGDFWLGYGWADRFRNEWDDEYRAMTSSWLQNRYGYNDGRGVTYVHSVGARYAFGKDKAGFADLGVGEGRHYRRNAQIVVSVPVDLGEIGVLTLTGYGHVGKYRSRNAPGNDAFRSEYHVSGSAQLKRGDWLFFAGIGHTSAPDSAEMNFRLTAWGNSDNRNFIQTWGQLDDFVWDGQNVVKLGAKYDIGNLFCLPGLSVGAYYLRGWNAANGRAGKSGGYEIDYSVEYAVPEGRLKGFAVGAYAAHLRYDANRFSGKQNRDDIKVVASYSIALERFLRRR